MAGHSVALPPIPDGYELETPKSALPPIPDGYELEGETKDPSYLQSLGKGTGDAIIGTANTVDKFLPQGGPNNDYYLNNIHQGAKNVIGWANNEKKQFGVDDASYGPSQSSQVQIMHPSTWSHVPGALLESAPGLGAAAGLGAVTGGAGFVGALATQNAGNMLDQRMANQGGAPATLSDKAIAGGSALGQAVLARFGLGKLGLGSGLGTNALGKAAIDLGGAAATNAGTGAASDVVDQLGRTVGTKTGTHVDPTEVGNAGLMGAATGVGAKALTLPGDALNANRFSQFGGKNAQAAADVAQTLNSPGYSTADVGGSAKAVKGASSIYASRANDAYESPNVQGALANGGPGLGQSVTESLGKLKEGTVLPEEHLSNLEGQLGPNGVSLTHNMRSMNVINSLSKMGYWGGSEGKPTFAGGITASPAGKFLNPLSFITSPGSHGAATSVGLSVLAHEFGASLPEIAKGMIAAAAVHPLLKAGDTVLGRVNPANEFATRFAPRGNFTPPSPPGAPPAPEPQGPGAFSPLPNSALAQIAKNRMELENQAALQPEANADNRAFDTQQRSAATAQDKLRTFLQKAQDAKANQAAPAPEPQGPGAFSPLPNSALAQIAKNRMELENRAALQPAADADNRAFDTQQRSAATAQDRLRTFLQRAQAVQAAQAGLNGPSPTPQAPSGLVVRSNGTGGTFNTEAPAPGAPLTTISNGKYSTQRDLSTVANRPGYTAAVQKALGARAGLGADLEKIAPNKTPEIEGFVNRMNNQSKSFQDASEHFEALVNDHLPASAQKAAFDAWNAHEAKIRGTFKQ